jgi:DNA-binding MarR family transcriptional regulator
VSLDPSNVVGVLNELEERQLITRRRDPADRRCHIVEVSPRGEDERTNFGSEDQAGFFRITSPVVRPFLKTPTQGAWTPIYLASSPDVEGITGQFFANRKPKTANKAAGDVDVTARL